MKKKSGKVASGQIKFDLDFFYDKLKFYYLSLYEALYNLYGYEEMLNLLLDYNISGQPSQRVMREVYEDCFYNFKRAIVRKANYIIDMKTGHDIKKEKEIFDKYKDEYAKKIRKIEHISPNSEVPVWMIWNALEKDGLIVRTPMEIKPELIKFFDIAIDDYGKYCGDKNLDFDSLIYLDEKIIKEKEQYRAISDYDRKKQLDENANFKDIKDFIGYLTYKHIFRYPKYIKNTEQIYEEYIIDTLNNIAVSDTERNIFLTNGGNSLY
ncbi:hypothetical protein OFO01_00240 [Campylobacter sp. JMF_01 NE2]|uniref:hypothetical protein n=1 Tax=unclassified Campylobacter TaxID=2593542 RepID=UPI0022E9EFC4|nr:MULTISPECIES: hypothetical protein [unclassified Campylobacter]MDA3051885.1 hypothetical protein [Campylobacter sp. JMF_03 NE3]MDA3066219.1 hypothetical protein [Campylobacter sp. JMF_01 NE2]